MSFGNCQRIKKISDLSCSVGWKVIETNLIQNTRDSTPKLLPRFLTFWTHKSRVWLVEIDFNCQRSGNDWTGRKGTNFHNKSPIICQEISRRLIFKWPTSSPKYIIENARLRRSSMWRFVKSFKRSIDFYSSRTSSSRSGNDTNIQVQFLDSTPEHLKFMLLFSTFRLWLHAANKRKSSFDSKNEKTVPFAFYLVSQKEFHVWFVLTELFVKMREEHETVTVD